MCLLDLVKEVGLEPKLVASTNGGEYHSACPKCGGDDRFFIQPNRQMKNCSGSYCCRQCGISGDAIQFCREIFGLSFKEAVARVEAVIPEKSDYYQPKKVNNHNHAKLKSLSKIWIGRANAFVEKAHKQILQQLSILEYLEIRGIYLEVVKKYKVGWNPKDLWNEKNDWGIDDEQAKRIWLPKGIVIPSIDPMNNVIRLKVRRYDWKDGDDFPKYIAISGGMNGLNIIGNTKNTVMIVVESELDAYALHNAVGDFAFVISVGSNIKNPDNVTDRLAKKTSNILICYDNDDAGKKMLDNWNCFKDHHASACDEPAAHYDNENLGARLEEPRQPIRGAAQIQHEEPRRIVRERAQRPDDARILAERQRIIAQREVAARAEAEQRLRRAAVAQRQREDQVILVRERAKVFAIPLQAIPLTRGRPYAHIHGFENGRQVAGLTTKIINIRFDEHITHQEYFNDFCSSVDKSLQNFYRHKCVSFLRKSDHQLNIECEVSREGMEQIINLANQEISQNRYNWLF